MKKFFVPVQGSNMTEDLQMHIYLKGIKWPNHPVRTYTDRMIEGDEWNSKGECIQCHKEVFFFVRQDQSKQEDDPARYSHWRTVCECNADKIGQDYIPSN